jgi:hypothetical protein
MGVIEDHPILERVFEQRVKEAIIQWVIMNRPDVAVEMRRVVNQKFEDQNSNDPMI